MTREDMYDLIIGAAVVAIGYMMWQQHKAPSAAPIAAPGAAPIANIPAPIEVQGNERDGYTYDLADLGSILQGAV